VVAVKIFKYPSDGTPPLGRCVTALGFFDGVHAAHRALIDYARSLADEAGLPLAVFTFPAECGVKGGTPRIYSTEARLSLFRDLGVEAVVIADFAMVADLSPEEFVREVLIGALDTQIAVAGFNYRFGKGAVGDAKMLENLMKRGGRVAKIHDELTKDGKTISATAVRRAIAEGDVLRARELLSVPYFIEGRIGHGNAVGRTLGYPTINMRLDDGYVMPRRGVYKTAVPIGEKLYTGLTNVGICPTFGEREMHAETYILDFEGDLYGERVRVYFMEFLRDEAVFESAEALARQIESDIKRVMEESI
jgi:riboflavin kinase/FMN adenylyltransferase